MSTLKPLGMQATLQDEFERAAIGASGLFAVSMHDLKATYADKKSSLTTMFNAASEVKSKRNRNIGWSVFWGVVFWPIAIYTGYKAYDINKQFNELKAEVQREVAAARLRPEGAAVEGDAQDDNKVTVEPKGKFKTYIRMPKV